MARDVASGQSCFCGSFDRAGRWSCDGCMIRYIISMRGFSDGMYCFKADVSCYAARDVHVTKHVQ
jgi:hypothetical protein